MKRIYLDNAATTPIDPEVLDTMVHCYREVWGNPSSLHSAGREAQHIVETARETVAGSLGAEPGEIVFTGGGTESNNTALKGAAFANRKRGNHVVASAIEHHSVIKSCRHLEEQGFRVTFVPPDRYGLLDPEEIGRAITGRTVLVSIMHANNEIGTIQPISGISRITRAKDVLLHVDAVQSCGSIPVDVDRLGVDLLSASAHKLYGPKGVGLLYVRRGTRIAPLLEGGGQEGDRRASTENVSGIAGFGKAVELTMRGMAHEPDRLSRLRDRLIRGISEKIEHTHLNGHPEHRLPNNVNVSFGHVEGESLVLLLDREGVACSARSACSSGSAGASHVLLATGVSRGLAAGAVRFSLGRYTTEEDIEHLLEILPPVLETARAMSPLFPLRKMQPSIEP